MKQWEPSLFFRVCRFVLRVQIVLGLFVFCYRYCFRIDLGVRSLLFVGWGIGLTGLFFFLLGTYELKKHGKAEKDQSFLLTSELVERGIYRVVRHPEYVGSMLLVVGSILIAQHWFILLLGSLLLLWFIVYVLPEEDRHLITKFGDHYICYIKNVPSINFLVGAIGWIRRGKKS